MPRHVFSADQNQTVTGPYMLRCADVETGKTVREIDVGAPMYDLALSIDEKSLALGIMGTQIIDAYSLELLTTLRTHKTWSVIYSPDKRWLATGSGDEESADYSVRLFNAASYELVAERGEVHVGVVRTVAFSPSSAFLVSGSEDKFTVIWSVQQQSLEVLHKLPGHLALVRKVIFTSENIFVTGSWDCRICVWDVNSGVVVKDIALHTAGVNTLALSPNKKLLASGGKDKRINIFNAETFERLKNISCMDYVFRVCFADNDTLIVGVIVNDMIAIDLKTRKTKLHFAKHGQPYGLVVCSL